MDSVVHMPLDSGCDESGPERRQFVPILIDLVLSQTVQYGELYTLGLEHIRTSTALN